MYLNSMMDSGLGRFVDTIGRFVDTIGRFVDSIGRFVEISRDSSFLGRGGGMLAVVVVTEDDVEDVVVEDNEAILFDEDGVVVSTVTLASFDPTDSNFSSAIEVWVASPNDSSPKGISEYFD